MKGIQQVSPPRERAEHRIVSEGLALLDARFERHVFERHIHDCYAIGFTLRGVQRFWCRGSTHDSTRGQVIAIAPGEVHDGESGAAGGYAYQMFYISIARMQQALIGAHERAVPQFGTRAPLIVDPELMQQLDLAWRAASRPAVPLAAEELLDRALIALAERHARLAVQRHAAMDRPALTRVRDYLHASTGRRVRLDDLAGLASMSRFRLSRQFQRVFGLPLHAYHLHVRLEEARRRLSRGESIASVACDLGFADQSHLHRRFKGAFGFTPGDWCAAARRSKTSRRSSS